MNFEQLHSAIGREFEASIIERLKEYVRIPAKSPSFDAHWQEHGHIDAAVELMASWCRAQKLPGATITVQRPRIEGRTITPLLLIDIPGELPDCVLLYGHLDKQPEFTGWLPGLGPWEPVIRDGKLYGRGGADDGYACFSSITAIAALKAQGVKLPRCVVMIEASEESGSVDLPAHLQMLGDSIGTPSLVVCLDAECGNYDQLWCTTSLRGNLVGRLTVRVLTEGVHSGMASGIAATPFRIIEQLLARIESPINGDILVDELQSAIPRDRMAQAMAAARVLGAQVAGKLPFAEGVQAVASDPAELLINSTWRATLAITGIDGMPSVAAGGNVLLPELTLKLSLRLPPTCAADKAAAAIKALLEKDPPYGAQVSFQCDSATSGWNAPTVAPWLEASMQRASQQVFAREAVHLGVGGTIPFMGMLGERFPQTQFFITGVLGPHANAHGPNEFLHIDYTRCLTSCVALVLRDHAGRNRSS